MYRPWKLFHSKIHVVRRFLDGLMKSRRLMSDVIGYQILSASDKIVQWMTEFRYV